VGGMNRRWDGQFFNVRPPRLFPNCFFQRASRRFHNHSFLVPLLFRIERPEDDMAWRREGKRTGKKRREWMVTINF
jgi:hypothetical protein